MCVCVCVCVSSVFLGGLVSSKRSVWIGLVPPFTFLRAHTHIWIIPRYLWPVHLFLEGIASKEHSSFVLTFLSLFLFSSPPPSLSLSLSHTRVKKSSTLSKKKMRGEIYLRVAAKHSKSCKHSRSSDTHTHTHTLSLCAVVGILKLAGQQSVVGLGWGGCRLDSRNWSNLVLFFFFFFLMLSTFFK